MRLRLLIAACVCALTSGPALAGQARPLDAEVKAVYLLNFARFATWPPSDAADAASAFPVCLLGGDPFGPALEAAVAGERVDRKPVVIRRLDKADDAPGCRILFVDASQSPRLKEILRAVGSTSVLTVSDMPRFVDQDGMIQFVSDGNRVRFQVNVDAAQRAGLMFSSELLRVAVSVKTTPRPSGRQ